DRGTKKERGDDDQPQGDEGAGDKIRFRIPGGLIDGNPARDVEMDLPEPWKGLIPRMRGFMPIVDGGPNFSDPGSVAVVALGHGKLIGGDEQLDQVADNLTFTMIKELAKLPGLKVTSQEKARARRSDDDPEMAGRFLGVAKLLSIRVNNTKGGRLI